MAKFMFILPSRFISSSCVQKKKSKNKRQVISVSNLLTPCPHQSFLCPLNQFLLRLSLSRHPSPVIYPFSFLLHHSFSTPLLSSHTLISWSERCFLRRACRQTRRSDGSLCGCFTLSSLQGRNRVVMGRWSPGLVQQLSKEKLPDETLSDNLQSCKQSLCPRASQNSSANRSNRRELLQVKFLEHYSWLWFDNKKICSSFFGLVLLWLIVLHQNANSEQIFYQKNIYVKIYYTNSIK